MLEAFSVTLGSRYPVRLGSSHSVPAPMTKPAEMLRKH